MYFPVIPRKLLYLRKTQVATVTTYLQEEKGRKK